jgi:hypothetical protein
MSTKKETELQTALAVKQHLVTVYWGFFSAKNECIKSGNSATLFFA